MTNFVSLIGVKKKKKLIIWQNFSASTTFVNYFNSQEYTIFACSVAQPCLTLWDSMNWSSPSSSVRGIFQASVVEWVVISCSKEYARHLCTCRCYGGKKICVSENKFSRRWLPLCYSSCFTLAFPMRWAAKHSSLTWVFPRLLHSPHFA